MSGGGPPGPISNPAVKPASADGSMGFGPCESRPSPTGSLPSLLFFSLCLISLFFSFFRYTTPVTFTRLVFPLTSTHIVTMALRSLQEVSLFATLSTSDLYQIAGKLTPVRLPEDFLVLREGEPGNRFFVIVDGQVDVLKFYGEKQQHLLDTLGRAITLVKWDCCYRRATAPLPCGRAPQCRCWAWGRQISTAC